MTTPTAVAAGTELTDELRQHIRDAYAENPSQMTVILARQLRVPEVFVLRSLPGDQVRELDATRWEELVRRFEALDNVHVIVSNGATTLEAFGRFGNFSNWHGFLNVQTKSLDMHIRSERIAAVFAVRKPSHMDNVPTLSFQFFDTDGASAFKVFLTFGGDKPSQDRVEQFGTLQQAFALAEAPSPRNGSHP